MDLRQYVRVIREGWWVIVLCLVVAVGAAAALAWTSTPKYAAHTKLFVSTKDSTDATAAYQGGLFGQQRVKSYADIVSSDVVVSAVKKQLGLPQPVNTLQGEISASAPLDTVLVNVTVTDTDRERARDIANAVGQQFSVLVNDLETPQGQKVSPVKVSVVEPASLPGAPVSPNKKLDLALGLLIGLAVGIGVAVLRETLDTTVGGREQAAALVDAPVLAAFREDDKSRERPLIVSDDSFSPRAEAFRQLRTNIRFLSVDQSVRSLVITSSVESEGKTTVAVNLAIALAQSGEQVDPRRRRPAPAADRGAARAESGRGPDQRAGRHDPRRQRARHVARGHLAAGADLGRGPPNPSEMLGSQRMRDLLDELLGRSTVVVFDTPPLLPVTDAAILANLTDGALLVTRVGKTKRDALAHSAEALRRVGGHVLGCVLNRVPARRKGSSYGYGYGYGGYYGAPSLRSQPPKRRVTRSAPPGG